MRPRVPLLWGMLALWLPAVAAAQASNVEFSVSGSSTVRNWTCTAQGTIAVTPATAGTPVPGFDKGVQSATVTVPLKAFRCPNDEMTQHLNEAMKSDKFPEVVYRLDTYAAVGGQPQATGSMTIAGVTQAVSFPVTLSVSAQGVQVAGSTRVEFAAFGLEAPTVFLGLLKVGPQIRIAFTGTLSR